MKVRILIGCIIFATLIFSLSHVQADSPDPTVLPGEFYAHSVASLIVEDPAVVVIRAGPDAYSWDSLPVLVPRLPLKENYAAGDEPPVMAAVELGSGRLVAYGGGATYDNTYTAQESIYRNMELGLAAIDWLDPENGKKVLFYWNAGSYHDSITCSIWIETIRSDGYQVDDENREGTPITSGLLTNYDVLLIINPENSFDNAEITAIKDWVYAGGGFFFSLESDHGARGKPYYSNPILEELEAGIEFQDDQLLDNVERVGSDEFRPRIYPISDPVWGDNLTGSFYAHSACTLVVSSPARVIVKAGPNAYNKDTEKVGGRQVLEISYAAGDEPPIMAAVELGQGRVVAYGGGATYASSYTELETSYRNMELGAQVIDWLDQENGMKVLFYSRDDYYKADTECATWITYLKYLGYTVDNTRDPITPELLAPYNVFTFVDTEDEFASSEITAIKDWVYAGGGFYLCGVSDYAGYGKVFLYNPILEALESGIEFQDDEVVDYVQNTEGKEYKPSLFLQEHEIWYRPYWMSTSVEPHAQSGDPGRTITYTMTIANKGMTYDNYSIQISDTENWSPTLSDNLAAIPPDENGEVTFTITVPVDAEIGTNDYVEVITTGSRYGASETVMASAMMPLPKVSIAPGVQSGDPGQTFTYTVTIKNEALSEENYSIEVKDVLGWNLTVSPTSLIVPPGESQEVVLTVEIPPDAEAGAEDRVTVTATSATAAKNVGRCTASVKEEAAAAFPVIPVTIAVIVIGLALVGYLVKKKK